MSRSPANRAYRASMDKSGEHRSPMRDTMRAIWLGVGRPTTEKILSAIALRVHGRPCESITARCIHAMLTISTKSRCVPIQTSEPRGWAISQRTSDKMRAMGDVAAFMGGAQIVFLVFSMFIVIFFKLRAPFLLS